LSSQDDQQAGSRFKPLLGITYNYHNLHYYNLDGTSYLIKNSKYFGAEFGFQLDPKKSDGIYIEWRNLLLGDLLVWWIYDMAGYPNSGFGSEDAITSGFFGRIDIGKQYGARKKLGAGITVADKFVSGVDYYLENPETSPQLNGFHFTPGIYGSYTTSLGNRNDLVANVSFQQYVFNFWQITEQRNYKYPAFIESSLNLHDRSGIYLRLAHILMISHHLSAQNYRLSIAMGYMLSL